MLTPRFSALALIAVAFIAGCSAGSEDTGVSSDAVTTACPEYSPPLCADGERIRVTKGADGCGVPECAAACPEYSPPLCADGERIRVTKGADGCGVPKCAAACPEYSPPPCAAGESIHVTKGADGCGVPTCK